MSRLSEMIKELCPDGVEYKKLKEIFDTKNGYTPSKSNESYWENGTIPWFRMEDIRENGHILSDSIQHVNLNAIKGELFPANSIIVATSATVGEHALITVPSLANQRFTYLMLKHEYANAFDIKFLFYYCYKLDLWCLSHLNQGSFPSVDMKQFSQFEIPVPPLAIQNEIVKLLDNFTELTAELTAELQLRKKQYSFYRDSLLNFSRNDVDVEWRTLGETCDTLSGFPFDSSQFTSSGIRLMRGMNVKRGVLDFREENNRYWKGYDGLEKYLLESDDIIIAMDGSLVGQSYGLVKEEQRPLLLVQRVARVRSRKANPHYIYHYISSGRFTDYVNLKRTAGAVPHISLRDIEHFKIPFPSTEKQNQIAAILDRFDALCHDLTQGLPAEIAARKKQYEYYRDKLLTFPRKGESARKAR